MPAEFNGTFGFSDNGLATVNDKGKMGSVNTSGEWVIPASFDNIYSFSKNGLAAVQLNKKWGYIDSFGKWAIPANYDEARDFLSADLAAVKLNDKWGYMRRGRYTKIIAAGLAFCKTLKYFRYPSGDRPCGLSNTFVGAPPPANPARNPYG